MRFKSDLKVQPELVASKGASRTALTKVHLNAEASEVWVTDSYMAARFPVELDEGDTSGPIPVDALKASRKPPLKHVADMAGTSIRCNSHVEVRHAFGEDASEPYLTIPRENEDYTFPNLAPLFPENLAELSICLNAESLHKLAKALGATNGAVRLRFTADADGNPAPLRPIRVDVLGSNEDAPSAILMPIRSS